MKKTRQQFLEWDKKTITLLGMSGVGKTHLCKILPPDQWFHYSGDYRIGTRYLDEEILDQIKIIAMQNPILRDQLCKDSIVLRNNITVDNLGPISDYLGKIGNPKLGGLNIEEFKRRQRLFRDAEVKAMQDIEAFSNKSRNIYNYPHFINDAGGSILSLTNTECWDYLSENTLVLYLKADEDWERTLIDRAKKSPKPLNYEEPFLDQHLAEYFELKNISSEDEIVPDEFVQWIFPKLVSWRKPQYQFLADQYGHTLDARRVYELRNERDFIEYVCDAIEGKS